MSGMRHPLFLLRRWPCCVFWTANSHIQIHSRSRNRITKAKDWSEDKASLQWLLPTLSSQTGLPPSPGRPPRLTSSGAVNHPVSDFRQPCRIWYKALLVFFSFHTSGFLPWPGHMSIFNPLSPPSRSLPYPIISPHPHPRIVAAKNNDIEQW